MTQRPSYLAFYQAPCRSSLSLSNTATGMALYDFYDKERLLKDEQSTMTRNGSSTGSDSIMFGSTGSYSSGWSSPFGSELGSTETEGEEDQDDGEFIAELTRQMADYMLEEEEEDENENAATKILTGSDNELVPTERHGRRLQSPIRTSTSCPAHGSKGFFDDPSQAVHLYKLENQPVANQQDSVCWGRRMTRTELTQHKKPHHTKNRGRRSDAATGGGGFGPQLEQRRQVGSGSGMRAVFLGGPPGSSSGSCGTGVFLPRGTTPVEVRKKSECSTVLIPTRVLQTLQLHFENMNSRSQSNSRPPQHDAASDTNPHHTQSRTCQVVHHHDMDLPQEWTY